MFASKNPSAPITPKSRKIKQQPRHSSASHPPRHIITPAKREHARRRSIPHSYHRHSSPRAAAAAFPIPQIQEKLIERPVTFPPSREALAAVDPALLDVPLQYVRDKLHKSGERLLHLAHCTRPSRASTSALPSSLDVRVDAALTQDAQPPSHILAVYSGPQPGQPKRKITLHAVHAAVYAAHTSRVILPSSSPAPTSTTSDDEDDATAVCTYNLPVTPMRLPAPEAFAPLNAYLYTHRPDVLLASLLLPPGTTSLPACEESLARRLATSLSRADLLAALQRIRGVQRNALALGVCDDDASLSQALNAAWQLAREALLEAQ